MYACFVRTLSESHFETLKIIPDIKLKPSTHNLYYSLPSFRLLGNLVQLYINDYNLKFIGPCIILIVE